jgi:hypothetical protein
MNGETKIVLPLLVDARNMLVSGNPAPALSALNVAIKYLKDLEDAGSSPETSD